MTTLRTTQQSHNTIGDILIKVILGALCLAGGYWAFAQANSSPLDGDYAGKIKIGTNAATNGVLHIREYQSSDNQFTPIAVLATESNDGTFDAETFDFDTYIPGSSTLSGTFNIQRMAGNGFGTQVVSLQITLQSTGVIHGQLTSNLIAPDGSLIELSFDFTRTSETTPMG